MQRSLYFMLALFMVSALFTTSCRKDSDNPVDGGNNQTTVTTTIIGVVSDESGKGMSGVSISAHGKTATTNEHGLFIIKDARVPQDRCFVLATNGGYFTNARAEKPKEGGVTQMRLSLMRNTASYSVSASAGGTVNISEGGSVQLPADAYVTGSGAPYTGTVKVAARWLNPTASNFFSFFPGDFAATRSNGSATDLYSYGVLNVELMSQTGEKLQLGSNKKATLKYPIPSSMLATAPSEMPLWYFDETIGMWKEDGKAVKQGNFYVGEVSHFTSWNCDIPTEIGFIKGRVMCSNEPVPGAIVTVGQRHLIADENGEYQCRVPRDITFEVSVDPTLNWGTQTAAPITAGPVAAQQTITVDVPVSPCPAYITGTLVDCNGELTEGIVQAAGNDSYGYVVVKNGEFKIRVEPNTGLVVNALGYNSGVSDPQNVQPVGSGETFAMGSIELCPQNTVTFMDMDLGIEYASKIALSPDGTILAACNYNSVRVYNALNGALIQTLSPPIGTLSVAFSSDGGKLMSTNDSSSSLNANTVVWSTSSWQEIRSFVNAGSAVFMPDGNSILGLADNNNVVQYDIATGTEMNRYVLPGYLNGLVGTRAGGTQFIVYGYDNNQAMQVIVWDMGTNSEALSFPFGSNVYVWSTQLSADGSVLFALSWNQLMFFNTATGQSISSIPLTEQRNASLSLSPDGTQYAGQVSDKGATVPPAIYNISNGSRVRLLPSPVDVFFSSVVYNSNGSVLAGVYNNDNAAKVRIWQLP